MKYRMLIIDDRIDQRLDNYKIILGNEFEIEYIEFEYFQSYSVDQILNYIETKSKDFDVFLCDLILDDPIHNFSKPFSVCDVAEKLINCDKPIVVISANYVDHNNANQSFVRLLNAGYNNVIYYLNWEMFHEVGSKRELDNEDTARIKSLISPMVLQVSSYYKKYKFIPDIMPNDDINILHISDLQFNDPKAETVFGSYRQMIFDYLRLIEIKPDLLVISGDIAYSGKPMEYELASKWLSKFGEILFGKDYCNRILIVPGNHDFDISISAGENLDIRINKDTPTFKKGELYFGNKSNIVVKKSNKQSEQNNAQHYFREFAAKLTQNDEWNTASNLNLINNRYSEYGIRFIQLNTAINNSINDIGRVKLNSVDIEKIIEKKTNLESKDIFTVLLAHHTPKCLGYDDQEDCGESWKFMQSLISTYNIKLFLCGHIHKALVKQLDPMCGRGVVQSNAATIALNQFARPEGEKMGFSLIKLIRSDSIVKKYRILKCYIDKDQNISNEEVPGNF